MDFANSEWFYKYIGINITLNVRMKKNIILYFAMSWFVENDVGVYRGINFWGVIRKSQ